ncbi:hypothetical protein KGQ72_00640 [Patescibacteria group bacterium]|nr:hypothetical protein [Patescibacteria group bacterium]
MYNACAVLLPPVLFTKEAIMGSTLEVVLTDHAVERIRARSLLEPETVVELVNNRATYEAHRENGVSYFVLWSTRDRRPFLVVVENACVISFYYTYEYHRRKDRCVILPVHIKLAKKALHDFFIIKNAPRYHVSVSWEEITKKGLRHVTSKKLLTCPTSEFESFKGTPAEFIGQKAEAVEALSAITIQKGCRATIVVKRSDGYTLASVELSA